MSLPAYVVCSYFHCSNVLRLIKEIMEDIGNLSTYKLIFDIDV